MRESGLADLFKSLRPEMVYVGVSAGSMVVSSMIGETHTHQPPIGEGIRSEDVVIETPQGELKVSFTVTPGLGLVDFALFTHAEQPNFPQNSLANGAKLAERMPVPLYGIDDQTSIKVVEGVVELISAGQWRQFTPCPGQVTQGATDDPSNAVGR